MYEYDITVYRAMLMQIYEITVSSELVYPISAEHEKDINGVTCNSICVTMRYDYNNNIGAIQDTCDMSTNIYNNTV